MKTMKKMLAILLCVLMVAALLPMAVLAAGAANISMEISATKVNVGDTVEITVTNKAMNVASFGCKLQFDKELMEFVSATGCDEESPGDIGLCRGKKFDEVTISSPDEANAIGQLGCVVVNTMDKDYDACVVYTATFRAKASGTVTFTLVEDSTNVKPGTGDGFSGVAGTWTVTVNAETGSECGHASTKASTNSNGTHDLLCQTCGQVVTAGETCTGTDDGNCTTAVACKCGYVLTPAKTAHTGGTASCTSQAKCSLCGTAYGDLGGHDYGDLIPAEEAVHTENELKPAVDAHYICSVCHQYFTADKTPVEYSDLLGETPEHTATVITTEITPPTCTEEGTEVTRPFVPAADPSPSSKRLLIPTVILGVLLLIIGILTTVLVRLLMSARPKAARPKRP